MAREARRACDRLAATQHGVLGHAPQRGPQRDHLVPWPSGLERALTCGMSRFAISRRTAADQWEAVLPDRTLVDLAGKLGAEDLERALDDVLRSGSASRARIAWTLDHLRRSGCALLRELLAQRGPGYRPPTELERRMLRLLRDAGFPMPVREYEIRAPGLSARIDFAYPNERVVVETDGYWTHSSRQDWQRDRTRCAPPRRDFGFETKLRHADGNAPTPWIIGV